MKTCRMSIHPLTCVCDGGRPGGGGEGHASPTDALAVLHDQKRQPTPLSVWELSLPLYTQVLVIGRRVGKQNMAAGGFRGPVSPGR